MAGPAEGVASVQAHDEVQALVQDPRNRSRRVERRRAQYWDDLLSEVALEPLALRARPVVAADEANSLVKERGDELVVEHSVLLVNGRARLLGDRPQHLGGAHAVRSERCCARLEPMLEPGDSDLEELVEIGRRDTEKLQALEKWDGRVFRLMQDAHVERELRELAVDVIVRQPEIDRVHAESRRSTAQ